MLVVYMSNFELHGFDSLSPFSWVKDYLVLLLPSFIPPIMTLKS